MKRLSTGRVRLARTRSPLVREGIGVGSGRGTRTHGGRHAGSHHVTGTRIPGKSTISDVATAPATASAATTAKATGDDSVRVTCTDDVTGNVRHGVTEQGSWSDG